QGGAEAGETGKGMLSHINKLYQHWPRNIKQCAVARRESRVEVNSFIPSPTKTGRRHAEQD
ncbi:MAG: hypothetical protein QFF03_17345, partial [Pseudomonadota bacterium]|nr:hypothetical protein [Pseudomonadota bacterium]